jgi:hypothetical protein
MRPLVPSPWRTTRRVLERRQHGLEGRPTELRILSSRPTAGSQSDAARLPPRRLEHAGRLVALLVVGPTDDGRLPSHPKQRCELLPDHREESQCRSCQRLGPG